MIPPVLDFGLLLFSFRIVSLVHRCHRSAAFDLLLLGMHIHKKNIRSSYVELMGSKAADGDTRQKAENI